MRPSASRARSGAPASGAGRGLLGDPIAQSPAHHPPHGQEVDECRQGAIAYPVLRAAELARAMVDRNLHDAEAGPDPRGCNSVDPYQTTVRGLATYTIPKVDMQLGLTFLSKPGMVVSFAGTPTNGGHLRANYTVPNSEIAPILGRPLSGGAANATVNLVEPGTKYGERVNELHLRVAKLLNFGGLRTNVGLDIFNIINAAPGLSYNENFIANGPWLTPTTVMTARFAKISAQIDF